jgi:hypothetical protein
MSDYCYNCADLQRQLDEMRAERDFYRIKIQNMIKCQRFPVEWAPTIDCDCSLCTEGL